MKKKITRRKFLSGTLMLLCSAVAAACGAELSSRKSLDKPMIGRTSRKKADYARELAG